MRLVFLLGTKSNSEVPQIMSAQDVLILPSIYDGWGAVVNEALTQGLYVICSDKCGAKELLSDERCGKVFAASNINELASAMRFCEDNIETIRANRPFRLDWAVNHIHGKVISTYMVDCLTHKTSKAPWLI